MQPVRARRRRRRHPDPTDHDQTDHDQTDHDQTDLDHRRGQNAWNVKEHRLVNIQEERD